MKKSKSFLSKIKADPDNHHISIFWFFLPKIIMLGTYENWYPVGVFDWEFIDDSVRIIFFGMVSLIIWYLVNSIIGIFKNNK